MTRKETHVARRNQAIADRLILILEDDPSQAFRRTCPRCGCGVIAYVCRPKTPRGPGMEVLRCEAGHELRNWKISKNWMWEGLDG
jgi:hypothetical protein